MPELLAAAGTVNLDPPAGVWMSGYGGRLEPCLGVHDPILARCVVVSDGVWPIALIAADCIGLDQNSVQRIRIALAPWGFARSGVMVAATHTHSGPASMPLRGVMGHVDNSWLGEAEAAIAELVANVVPQLVPVEMLVGQAEADMVGFNRQDRSHPTDRELITVQFVTPDGAAIATILNYAVHPVVLGPSNLMLSADIPGAACRAAEEAVGGTALYLQGACGDVDPCVQLEKGWGKGTFEDVDLIGARLAELGLASLSREPAQRPLSMKTSSMRWPLPLQPVENLGDRSVLREALQCDVLAAQEKGDEVAQACAVAMVEWLDDLEDKIARGVCLDLIDTEIQGVRIGDLTIVGLPFEPYSEIGLNIKRALAPRAAMVVGYANGLFGYCATDRARDQGGYGPEGSHRWFPRLPMPLDYGSDAILTRRAVDLADVLQS